MLIASLPRTSSPLSWMGVSPGVPPSCRAVAAVAEQAFGEEARAWRWPRKPKRHFNGKRPIEMLATETGARLVEEMVAQIEDGMAARSSGASATM